MSLNILNKLTVRANMVLFTCVALIAMACIAAIAMFNLNESNHLADRLMVDIRLSRAIGNVDMMHEGLQTSVFAARLAGPQATSAERETIATELSDQVATIHGALADIQAALPEALGSAFSQVKPKVEDYARNAQALVQATLSGSANHANYEAFNRTFAQLEIDLDAFSGRIEDNAQSSVSQKINIQAHAKRSMLAAVFIGTVIIIAVSYAFARSTLSRLGAEPAELSGFAQRIAQGDLEAGLAGDVGPQSVGGAMLRMRNMLTQTVQQIRDNAQSVASGSGEIAQGNSDLSARTEQQASALQQTAASMEELSVNVKQNADHARQANELARGASEVAGKGGQVVEQVVETMKGINDSSKRIADIIGVIDGIAFQTNILALNAAVEAARAGEQGRGFAVVASEVRSLARRSADAAKEIKKLIDTSVQRVEHGSALVDQAGATMDDVVNAIKRVTDIMGEISHASTEQSDGVMQVNQAISQMDQTTQQNAALVEQNAAASSHLQTQAEQLISAVATFRVAALGTLAQQRALETA